MSVAPAPRVVPAAPAVRPEVVPPRHRKPSNSGLWIAGVLAVAMVGGAIYWQRRSLLSPGASASAPAIRTARVAAGPVYATLRLTGVTAAQNFVSLAAPQLRGSRGDRFREAPAAPVAASNSTPNTSPAPAATASAAATRFHGAPLRGSATAATAQQAQATGPSPSAAMGTSGLGTAADAFPPSGGGGNNNNNPGDFLLVLRHAAKPGIKVQKGEPVAEFDRLFMQQRLEDYRASVAQTAASLKKQKAELEATRKAHEQLVNSAKGAVDKARLDMKTIPVLSAIDAERARLAFEEAEARRAQLIKETKFVEVSQNADLRNAELQLEQARLELKRAEANGDRMAAAAPIGGLTVALNTWRGADFGQIQEGDQLWPGQFYMQIVDTSSMVIDARVNQADVEKLRLGQKALVRFDAYNDLTLPAHVASIAAVTKPGGFRPSFVKEVPVRLKLDRTDPRVIPDLSVSAEVTIGVDLHPAAVAPLGAVFHGGPLDKAYVFVQRLTGWERRDVELGLRSNTVAAVKAGLAPGDLVALDRPTPFEESAQESP